VQVSRVVRDIRYDLALKAIWRGRETISQYVGFVGCIENRPSVFVVCELDMAVTLGQYKDTAIMGCECDYVFHF
jgi:hypothetical protein